MGGTEVDWKGRDGTNWAGDRGMKRNGSGRDSQPEGATGNSMRRDGTGRYGEKEKGQNGTEQEGWDVTGRDWMGRDGTRLELMAENGTRQDKSM